MNWKAVSVVLVVLLVGMSGTVIYQYTQNRQLHSDVSILRERLDRATDAYFKADAQRSQLQTDLAATEIAWAKDQTDIDTLQKEIDSLREDITDLRRREGAITVGLSFLWGDTLQQDQKDFTNSGDLEKIVWELNRIWDDMDVYFFIYHNDVLPILPQNITAGNAVFPNWISLTKSKFIGNDIPILIISDILNSKSMNASFAVASFEYEGVITVSWKYVSDLTFCIAVLTHEILHVFGITDEQINKEMGALGATDPNFVMAILWLTQIRASAKLLQMSIP